MTVSENRFIHQLPRRSLRTVLAALLLAGFVPLLAAQTTDDWQPQVRKAVESQHIDAALAIVDQRLADAPEDLEAHGWRGRLLAWKGRWSEGEAEYRIVLDKFPNDTEILTGLSDVLLWQKKYTEALQALDQARKISPADPEILSRRARVLALLGRTPEARSEYQQTLLFDTENTDARTGLDSLRENTKHELRVGEDVDVFNYADAGQTQGVSLSSRWNQRWSTVFGVSTYQRFSQDAVKFLANTAFTSPRGTGSPSAAPLPTVRVWCPPTKPSSNMATPSESKIIGSKDWKVPTSNIGSGTRARTSLP